jgi:hypothetical protein
VAIKQFYCYVGREEAASAKQAFKQLVAEAYAEGCQTGECCGVALKTQYQLYKGDPQPYAVAEKLAATLLGQNILQKIDGPAFCIPVLQETTIICRGPKGTITHLKTHTDEIGGWLFFGWADA